MAEIVFIWGYEADAEGTLGDNEGWSWWVVIGQLEYGSLTVIHTVTGSQQQGSSQPEARTGE